MDRTINNHDKGDSKFVVFVETMVKKCFSLLLVPYFVSIVAFVALGFVSSGFSLTVLVLGFFISALLLAPINVLFLFLVYLLRINRWAIRSFYYIIIETTSFVLIGKVISCVKDYCLNLNSNFVFTVQNVDGQQVLQTRWLWQDENVFCLIFILELACLIVYDYFFVRKNKEKGVVDIAIKKKRKRYVVTFAASFIIVVAIVKINSLLDAAKSNTVEINKARIAWVNNPAPETYLRLYDTVTIGKDDAGVEKGEMLLPAMIMANKFGLLRGYADFYEIMKNAQMPNLPSEEMKTLADKYLRRMKNAEKMHIASEK